MSLRNVKFNARLMCVKSITLCSIYKNSCDLQRLSTNIAHNIHSVKLDGVLHRWKDLHKSIG